MTQAIHDTLKRYWGYDEFRPLQKEAITTVLSGRDSVVVLPTGGGKSLCFQVPALQMQGTALVLSPLISLMKDQVDALRECGVAAARLDSTMTSTERGAVRAELLAGKLKLLYLSPERLLSDDFLAFLARLEVSFVAVDEAHCVSLWGHDFRPEYRELGRLKDVLPETAVHGFTATATEQVRDDIAAQLRMDGPAIFVGSFDRPNLVYDVQRRTNLDRQLEKAFSRHAGESGVIYCIRRAEVDTLCARLRAGGLKALPYHAGLSDTERRENQDAFIRDEIDIIVATVAFGMGIDKSNLRFVIHTGMPKTLEHYQQESGRAGRDGLEAHCTLFYSSSDYAVWKSIQSDLTGAARDSAIEKLNAISAYCSGVTCRHRALVEYFGQSLPGEDCGACDVCLGTLSCTSSAMEIAQKILSCVVRLRESFGAEYTCQVLHGSREKRILGNGHEKLSTYGLLKENPKRGIRDWLEQLVTQGHLAKQGEYSTLRVTDSGWRVLRGQETPRLLEAVPGRTVKRSRAEAASLAGVDETLFAALRKLRQKLAHERGVPAYVIFSDAALRDMARRQPASEAEFLDVHGVGEKKLAQYGEVFLTLIAEHGGGENASSAGA